MRSVTEEQTDAADRSDDVPEDGERPEATAEQRVQGVPVRVPTDEDMRALGRDIATVLLPGDLLVLTGRLGAGKTTLVQGIAQGLGVERPVTSPSFVIARVHPPSSGGLPLVHADAYRLSSIAEIEDLDLETPAEQAVTVVEWGEGLAEDLSEDRLEILIDRRDDDEREVRLTGVGRRWARIFHPNRA